MVKRKQRDWTLPGHKYTGPGNSIVKGKPNNANDAISRDHDLEYSNLGDRAYWKWSSADQTALDRWSINEYGGALGKAFFTAKKAAFKGGLIGQTGEVKMPIEKKRLRSAFLDPVNPAMKKMPKHDRSLRNLQTQEAMAGDANMSSADGDGSGNNLGLKETPIDDPRFYSIHRGPPDETFSSLPYFKMAKYLETASFSLDQAFRMNSPYDPDVTIASQPVPGTTTVGTHVPLVDAADSDSRAARWFRMYAGMYKYYHVVSCRYNIYIENLAAEPLYVHLMFYNEQLPPTGATNEDIMTWKGVRTQILAPRFHATAAGGYITSNETSALGTGQQNDETDGGTAGVHNYASTNNVSSRGGHVATSFNGN